jgi:hypothetical protein
MLQASLNTLPFSITIEKNNLRKQSVLISEIRGIFFIYLKLKTLCDDSSLCLQWLRYLQQVCLSRNL